MAVHYLRIQSLHSYMSLQVLEWQVGDLELSSLLRDEFMNTPCIESRFK